LIDSELSRDVYLHFSLFNSKPYLAKILSATSNVYWGLLSPNCSKISSANVINVVFSSVLSSVSAWSMAAQNVKVPKVLPYPTPPTIWPVSNDQRDCRYVIMYLIIVCYISKCNRPLITESKDTELNAFLISRDITGSCYAISHASRQTYKYPSYI
jgi:hypothetical protein